MTTRQKIWLHITSGPPSFFTRYIIGYATIGLMAFNLLVLDRFMAGQASAQAEPAPTVRTLDQVYVTVPFLIMSILASVGATATFVWAVANDRRNIDTKRDQDENRIRQLEGQLNTVLTAVGAMANSSHEASDALRKQATTTTKALEQIAPALPPLQLPDPPLGPD